MDLSKYKAKPKKTIRMHTDDLIENLDRLNSYNYIKDNYIYSLTKIACEYHDYGKVNREFQKRIVDNSKFNDKTEMAHNVLSLYFINPDDFKAKKDYYKVAFAVLFHHNYCDNLSAITKKEEIELSVSLLEEFEIYKVRGNARGIKDIAKDYDAILIKGLLNKCDYAASGDAVIEYKNDFLSKDLNNLLLKWKNVNKESKWNELQEFCVKNSDKNIMVVAQTGMGKTEAGLLWIGDNKGFFILPLKTAINAIYKRIKEQILERENIQNKVALLHSDALAYYNNDKYSEEINVLDYYNQSRQLSIPLSISTMDQLFDFVFKCQGYELKLATLSYSKIVIDEIQMYSADLLAYLIYGIKTINKLGGRIAILTATLAPFIKDLFKSGDDPIEFEEATFVDDSKRHNLKVLDCKINSEIIFDKYMNNIKDLVSNKMLVVCNTVKKAQQIYSELEEMGIENINLLHSKFIKRDRSIKENEIMEFGKTELNDSGIWISTQIVEASLDVDFDYLFTELSDINGLFQRFGRCNRKGVKSVEEVNCYVFLEIDTNLLTNGNKGFIDRQIYNLSREALKNIEGVLTEGEKISIINKYLTTENLKGSDYYQKYMDFQTWIESKEPYEIQKEDANLRNIVSFNIIPRSIYEENLDEIEENSRLLMNENMNKLERVSLKEAINKYTVPVGRYDIEVKGKKLTYKRVQLSKYEFVDVIDCNYNQLGFVRYTSEDIKGLENNFDNFL